MKKKDIHFLNYFHLQLMFWPGTDVDFSLALTLDKLKLVSIKL